MSFFRPEDFNWLLEEIGSSSLRVSIADMANAKIDKEGIVLYRDMIDAAKGYPWYQPGELSHPHPSHKAILINIEPIEKCKHPKEKVKPQIIEDWDKTKNYSFCSIDTFICECGARVKPSQFTTCSNQESPA